MFFTGSNQLTIFSLNTKFNIFISLIQEGTITTIIRAEHIIHHNFDYKLLKILYVR